MGYELDIPDKILQTPEIGLVEEQLLLKGWRRVDYGFHLGRHTGAIDIHRAARRYLIYGSNVEDLANYNLLLDRKIPTLKVVHTPNFKTSNLAVARVPLETRALDSMTFPDQLPASDYLGSLEMMAAMARFLATLYLRTSRLPRELRLESVCFVSGKEDLIRMIPPLDLVPRRSWQGLLPQLQATLGSQDPSHDHKAQIEQFERCFIEYLEDNG